MLKLIEVVALVLLAAGEVAVANTGEEGGGGKKITAEIMKRNYSQYV